MRPYWAFMCEPYIERLAESLTEQDGLPIEEARIIIQGFLWTDMARRIRHIADFRIQSILPATAPAASSNRLIHRVDRIPAAAPAMHMLRRFVAASRASRRWRSPSSTTASATR